MIRMIYFILLNIELTNDAYAIFREKNNQVIRMYYLNNTFAFFFK